MKHQIKTYEGNKPYVFISYSHQNTDVVLPIVKAISDRAYRIWYDSGIKSGDNWADTIASRLKSASCVICFISRAFCDSHNCCNELIYALNKRIPIMVIYLEDFEVPGRIELQIAQAHALFLKQYDKLEQFIVELERTEHFAKCSSADEVMDPAEEYMQSGAMYMNIQPKWAREAYRLAIEKYEECSGLRYELHLSRLATAYGSIGKTYIKERRWQEAQLHCEKALTLFETAVSNGNKSSMPPLANTYFDLGVTYRHVRMAAKAITMMHKAAEIYELLCENDFDTHGKALAEIYLQLSALQHSRGNYEEMGKVHQKSLTILEQLSILHPDEYSEMLANAYVTLCVYYIGSLRWTESMLLCDKALNIFDRLCSENPDAFEPKMAHVLWDLSIKYKDTNEQCANSYADKLVVRALSLYEKLEKKNPGRYMSCINGLRYILGDER